jgi:hypothetical protein
VTNLVSSSGEEERLANPHPLMVRSFSTHIDDFLVRPRSLWSMVYSIDGAYWTVKKGHARTFSSELIHVLLLKILKVSNILENSS